MPQFDARAAVQRANENMAKAGGPGSRLAKQLAEQEAMLRTKPAPQTPPTPAPSALVTPNPLTPPRHRAFQKAVAKAMEADRKIPRSPVHDKLRATPGTLERNMAFLDRKFGNDPEYVKNREKIKYQVQGIDTALKKSFPGEHNPVLQSEAEDKANIVLGREPKHLNKLLAKKSKPVYGPTEQPEGETLWDAVERLRSEQDLHVSNRAGLYDAIIQIARTIPTPDYSEQLDIAAEGAVPGSGKYARGAGKVLSGFMGVFNPGEQLAGFQDTASFPGAWLTTNESAPDLLLGKTDQDRIDSALKMIGGMWGGALGAKGMGAVRGMRGRGIGVPVTEAEIGPSVAPRVDPPEAPAGSLAKAPVTPDVVAAPKTTSAPKSRKRLKAAIAEVEAGDDLHGTPAKPAPVEPAVAVAPAETPVAAPQKGKRVSLGKSRAQHPRGGEWHEVETKVVELDDLIASNDHRTFEVNPAYPQQLQPRDRTGAGVREQVLDNAARLDKGGEITTDFLSTEKGAPIIGPDDVVEAGNGRVMAIRAARDSGNEAYKAYQAKVRALHPDAADMDHPVLVRTRVGDLDEAGRIRFAEEANGRAAAAYTRVESAINEADTLNPQVIASLSDVGTDVGAALKSSANAEAVQKFLDTMDPSEKRALVADEAGLLGRMRNAIVARVVGGNGADVLGRIIADADLRRISAGIERAAIPLLKAIAKTETGEIAASLDFRDTFAEALRIVDDYRGSNNKAGYWEQGRLDEPDPNAMKLARALVDSKSQAQVEAVLEKIANRVGGATDGGLFDDGPPPAKTLDDVFSDFPQTEASKPAPAPIELPITPDPPGPIKAKKGPRGGRESGQADIKTLAAAGAVVAGVAGAAASEPVRRWFAERGLVGAAEVGVGLGLTALLLKGARSGGIKPGRFAFGEASAVLDARTLAERAVKSGDAVEALFGESADAILSARAEHVLRSGESSFKVEEAGAEAFGQKDFMKSPLFEEWNGQVRDVMEANIAEGRPWHEGLPAEWKAFVEKVRPVLDEILDEAESADVGIRIRVANDGTQHSKLAPDAEVRVRGGKIGRYKGTEPIESPVVVDGDDPFNAPPDLPDDNSTTRQMRERQIRRKDESEGRYNILVEVDGANGPEIVKVKPGETFGRPVDRIGEGYVPRFFKGEFSKLLRNVVDAPAELRTALGDMLAKMNPEMGLSSDQMVGRLADIAQSMDNGDADIASFLANLEKERQWELAKFEWTDAKGKIHTVDPYESSYIDSLSRYIDRGWKRVAIARQFGPAPRALGEVIGRIKAGNPAYGSYLEKLIGRSLGLGPETAKPEFGRTFAKAEGAYQTLSKLTGFTTQIAQVNDVLFSLTEAGAKQVLGAGYDLMFAAGKDEARQLADIMSASRSNWAMDLAGGDGVGSPKTVGGKLRKGLSQVSKPLGGEVTEGMANLADAVMTGVGIRNIDRTMKRLAAITGLRDATAALEQAAAAKSAGRAVPGEVMRKLERYGIADAIDGAVKNGTEATIADRRVLSDLSANIRGRLTYSGAPEDFPLWMSSGWGSVAMRFKKPQYVATRMLLRNVVGELAQGNVKPAARLIVYGVALGEAAGFAKDVVRLDGMDEETRKLWAAGKHGEAVSRFLGNTGSKRLGAKALDFAQGTAKGNTLHDLLWAATTSLYEAGGLGIPGEWSPSLNRRTADITGNPAPDPWRAMAPVSAGEIVEIGKRVIGAEQRTKRYAEKLSTPVPNASLSKVVGEYGAQEKGAAAFEQFRSSFALFRRFTDLADLRPDLVRLHDLERKDARTGGKLKPADYAEMAKLKAKVMGRFNAIAGEVEGAKGGPEPSLRREVFETAGITDEGTPLRRKRKRG